MTPRESRRERGTAAIEFVAIVPLVLLAGLIALQVGVVGWTAVATGDAARNGARAAVLQRDADAAARGSLPGAMEATSVDVESTGDGRRVTVDVKIPHVTPFEIGSVTRSVEMPELE